MPPIPPSDRYVVVGNPVAHSRSPFIHAEFARQTGQAMRYDRLLCPMDGFEATLRGWAADRADGTPRGCNVTVPFKFDAYTLADRRTPRAQVAGAANVLRFDDDEGWLGDNTDGAGLVNDIQGNAGFAIAGRRLLVVGAGGATAGILGPLLAAGPAELVVANRSPERAVLLVERHRAVAGATALHASGLDDCGTGFDLVINASSSSLLGAAVPVAAAVLARGALAIDLMYGPPAQPFVDWAKAHGAQGRDGLGMLVEQAAEAFLLWRGVRPETAPVLQALRRRVESGQP